VIKEICRKFDFTGEDADKLKIFFNYNIFSSWGGKRSRMGAGTQKIVIRTPFHAWGGKRSGEMIDENY
jgi:hypothetical protein